MAIQVLITDDHKMVRRGLRGFLELDPTLALLVFGSLLDLPGAALTRLRYPLPITEHGVHKVHVGVHRLAGKGLCGVRLALLLVAASCWVACRFCSAWMRRFSTTLLKKYSVS